MVTSQKGKWFHNLRCSPRIMGEGPSTGCLYPQPALRCLVLSRAIKDPASARQNTGYKTQELWEESQSLQKEK